MLSLARTIGNNALVLKEFSINREGPEYVHIVARKSGLISWILTTMGIDSTTTFRVFADRIIFEEGSLSGNLSTTMPLRSISIATCGYTKPFIYILLTIIMTLATFLIFPLFILLAGLFLFLYFHNKALVVAVVTNSGWPASVCFKSSIIEGVEIKYEQAKDAVNIINELILLQANR